MKEVIATRREVLGDSANKPETIKSIETLQRLGVLMPMRDLDLYHGRSGHGEKWSVREVNNAGNMTGNRNINKIPALHTGKYDVANDFAETRTKRAQAKGDQSSAEVHKIVSADPDASIINHDIDWSRLSKLEYNDALQAIHKSLPSVFEGSPLKFEDRHKVDGLEMKDFLVNKKYGGFIGEDLIKEYSEKYHLSMDLTNQICGAINARLFLSNYPEEMSKVIKAFTDNTGKAEIKGGSFPINREYVASWLEKMHVVGEKKSVLSATIGKPIDTFMLFDFERVNTESEIKRRIKQRYARFGKLALTAAFRKNLGSETKSHNGENDKRKSIKEALNNPYASPQQIVEAAKKVPGFKDLFEADAGNWEKYSLAEHTETVLENFERNYADRMPVDLLPIMKLGLLLHDVGKTEAARKGDKKNQKQYNMFYAEKFMQEIKVGDKEREFVLRMIGPGKTLAEKVLLGDNRNDDFNRAKRFCANTFQKYTGQQASESDANGVFSMILALQTCDSAAYTDAALTRTGDGSGVVYRNASSFNSSFDRHGITRRGVSFKI